MVLVHKRRRNGCRCHVPSRNHSFCRNCRDFLFIIVIVLIVLAEVTLIVVCTAVPVILFVTAGACAFVASVQFVFTVALVFLVLVVSLILDVATFKFLVLFIIVDVTPTVINLGSNHSRSLSCTRSLTRIDFVRDNRNCSGCADLNRFLRCGQSCSRGRSHSSCLIPTRNLVAFVVLVAVVVLVFIASAPLFAFVIVVLIVLVVVVLMIVFVTATVIVTL